MTDENRWLDDPSLDASLRDALEAGKREVPSAERLAAIAAALPPLPPGGPGGGGGGGAGGAGGGSVAPPAAGLSIAAKALLGAGALAAAIGATAVVRGVLADAPPDAPSASTILVPTVSAPPVASSAAAVAPSTSVSVASHPTFVRPPVSAMVAAPDPARDSALVEEASRAMSTPDVALDKCNEHERLFPKSALAEERDRLRIEALVKLHRDAEAKTRRDAFAARYPGSAYQRRIDALFVD